MTRSPHGLSTGCGGAHEWLRDAWCRGADDDVFFTESLRPLALHHCLHHCEVLTPCRREALRLRPAYAVMGGIPFNAKGEPLGWRMAPATSCVECGALPPGVACGTNRGYARHRRLGEPTCQPCRDAHAAWKAEKRSRLAARRRVLLGEED
jgi:hypothetical protein